MRDGTNEETNGEGTRARMNAAVELSHVTQRTPRNGSIIVYISEVLPVPG